MQPEVRAGRARGLTEEKRNKHADLASAFGRHCSCTYRVSFGFSAMPLRTHTSWEANKCASASFTSVALAGGGGAPRARSNTRTQQRTTHHPAPLPSPQHALLKRPRSRTVHCRKRSQYRRHSDMRHVPLPVRGILPGGGATLSGVRRVNIHTATTATQAEIRSLPRDATGESHRK